MTHKLALVFFVQSLLGITLPLFAAEGLSNRLKPRIPSALALRRVALFR